MVRHVISGASVVAAATAVAGFVDVPDVLAQSALTRTPNLSGGWVGTPGTVQFNFLHRFWLLDTDGDETKDRIRNSPTFHLAAPLAADVLVGLRYASNSLVVPGDFNEWELMGRWRPAAVDDGSPVDLAVTGAYNATAGSADGEVSIGFPAGPLTLFGVGRAFSDAYDRDESGWAVGGGVSVRLTDGMALAGDLVAATDRTGRQKVAWGGGLQMRVPLTPHSLSLQATNSPTGTLQGASIGDGQTRWGFEFTIPFTLSRYFGGSEGTPEAGGGQAGPEAGDNVVTMTNRLTFEASTVRIRAGETVTWRNTSDLVHTVTGDPSKATREGSASLPEDASPFDSGDLAPGEDFTRTFTTAGEYVYFCVPHELAGMVGRVVVSPGDGSVSRARPK